MREPRVSSAVARVLDDIVTARHNFDVFRKVDGRTEGRAAAELARVLRLSAELVQLYKEAGRI